MSQSLSMPFNRQLRTRTCAAQLFGSWMIEPKWFAQAIEAVRSGKLKPAPVSAGRRRRGEGEAAPDRGGARRRLRRRRGEGVQDRPHRREVDRGHLHRGDDAQVPQQLRGLLDGGGAAGGARGRTIAWSTRSCCTSTRRAGVARARATWRGRRRGGEGEAALHVLRQHGGVGRLLGGSQADKVWGNEIALVGSIGTYCVLEDDSKMQEEIGIKLTVVSTGPYKGLGADGKVTEQLISDVQREIDDLNERFLVAVAAGRELQWTEGPRASRRACSRRGKGRAGRLGRRRWDVRRRNAGTLTGETEDDHRDQFKAYAAEHPDAAARLSSRGTTRPRDLKPKPATVSPSSRPPSPARTRSSSPSSRPARRWSRRTPPPSRLKAAPTPIRGHEARRGQSPPRTRRSRSSRPRSSG
jgi:hypothetical protein